MILHLAVSVEKPTCNRQTDTRSDIHYTSTAFRSKKQYTRVARLCIPCGNNK